MEVISGGIPVAVRGEAGDASETFTSLTGAGLDTTVFNDIFSDHLAALPDAEHTPQSASISLTIVFNQLAWSECRAGCSGPWRIRTHDPCAY